MTSGRLLAWLIPVFVWLAASAPSQAAEWTEQVARLRAEGKWQEALSVLRPRAEAGEVEAQAALGNLLLLAANPLRDEAGALRWLRRAARKGSINALATVGYPSPYVSQANLACRDAVLTVMTSCAAFEPGEGPFCFAQTFLFESAGGRARRRIFTETHADFRSHPLLAVQMGCLASGGGRFVVDFSNYGNGRECTGCEERRYFDAAGLPLAVARNDNAAVQWVQITSFPAPGALESWFRD